MLRDVFVIVLLAAGIFAALRGTFEALLLYLWIAYFRPEQWVWDDLIGSLNLSYLAGSYLLLITLFSREKFRFDTRAVLLAMLLADTLLSVIASQYAGYAWPFWIDFAKVIVITYLISVLAADPARFRLTLLVISLSLGFEAAKQGWAGMILDPGAQNNNKIPFLGDNNGVALGMLMLVPIMLALAQTAQRRWEGHAMRFLAVGVLYRALATYSRGAFVAAGALACLYAARSRHKTVTLLGMAAVAIIVLPVLPHSFWERMGTIPLSQTELEQVTEADTSVRGRLHFWRVAVRMANANPLTGIGHDAYNAAYDDYDFSHGEFGRHRSVHSAWFGVFAELGYPGLLLFGGNMLAAFFACWRVRKLASAHPELVAYQRFSTALESSLAVFAVGGSFVFFQYNEMLWHVIGLTMALQAIVYRCAEALQPARAAEGRPGPARARPAAAMPAYANTPRNRLIEVR